MLPAVPSAESGDALVISDQGTTEFDRRRYQEPIRRIAMREMLQLIAARCGAVSYRNCGDPGTLDKSTNPGFDREVEIDPSRVDE